MQEKAGVIVGNGSFLYFEYPGNYTKKKKKTKCVDSLQQGAELIGSTHGRKAKLALDFAIKSCITFSGYVFFLQRISQCVCIPLLAVPHVETMSLLQGCVAVFLFLPGFLSLCTC